MSDSISALDAVYVRLGRAATLVVGDREDLTADDFMDQFKSAVFAGELDPPSFYVGETRNDPCNWLHMEIEVPRCTLPPSQAALQVRPKQLYGVNRETIASVLLTTDALPGDNTRWWPVFDDSAPDYKPDNAFSALAAIPFRDFPERGRRELEALLVPKAKLAAWFGEQGQPVPAFLADQMSKVRRSGERAAVPPRRDARPKGRPHKQGWPRIIQLVRQLHQDHPDWQRKHLAFEAWRRATDEFSESELPSVATIQRSMVEILNGGSG